MALRRSGHLALVGVALALAVVAPSLVEAQTPAPRQMRAGDLTRKVLLIGIDGVRPDVMAEVATPNLDALVATGAWSMRARTTIPTISGPGWSSMLIGVWPDKHNVFNNNFAKNRYDEYPDFLTRVESVRPELETFVAADWLPLVSEDAGGPLISGAVDSVVVLDGYELGWAAADSAVTAATTEILANGDPDAVFLYLGNPDETSHETHSIGAEYRAAIEEADRRVGQVLRALRARPGYAQEDWLVLVSTDHGRRPDGGHGGRSEAELTTFYIANGPSVTRGEIEDTPQVVDIAVTALAHLGITIDPSWKLDGHVVGIGEGPDRRR